MSREEAFEILKEIFNNVFDLDDEIDENTKKEDIEEWDSMSHILLLSKVQEKFNIKLDTSNLIKYESVKDILDDIVKE